jgi:hypothetical protein
MNPEISVRNIDVSDDSGLRNMEVNLAKNYIKTPTKSITTRDFFKDTEFPFDISMLSEHFIRFSKEHLRDYYYDKKVTDKINQNFAKHKRKVSVNTTTLTIVEYRTTGISANIPTEEEIKALINAAYAFSDVVVIPSVPKFSRNIDIDTIEIFLKYVTNCLERIEIINKKKIMGYIPMIAPAFLEIVIDFYLDNGVNAYCVDFDGTTLSTNLSQIEAVKRTLAERGYEENSFLHYINIAYGKAINDIGVLSARDLLGFGHGLDSLGGIHTGPKRGKQFFEWLKEHKDVLKNTTRVLSKEDYGYYRYKEEADLNRIYPEDAMISLEDIIQKGAFSTKRKLLNIVNLQQQALESNKLREIVKETPDKTIEYFDSKRCVSKDDIKQMKK